MADWSTNRVLAIDGGGARGLFSLNWLKHFVLELGEDPDDRTVFTRRFNCLSGTSVGALIALCLATEKKSINELIDFFNEHAPYIFSLSSLFPSWRPNKAAKIALAIADIPFYQSSGPTENAYGAGLLKTLIQEIFGSATLEDVGVNVVIPGYQLDTKTYVTFSNLVVDGFIGQDFLISDVALAASAAPVYLPSWVIGDHTYIDSGVYQNNSAFFAYAYAKALRPTFNRTCLLNVGTGIGDYGFDPGGHPGPPPEDFKSTPVYQQLVEKRPDIATSLYSLSESTVETFFSLFEIASTGGQESIAKCFQVLNDYSLDPDFYYRANANLQEDLNTELDNTDADIRTYYADFANQIFDDDIIRITNFIGHFTA
jgi:predicted acylesterase/phospholipase RssA